MSTPIVAGFYDLETATITYVAHDGATGRAAIIDPVRDYDPKSGRTATVNADKVIAHVRDNGLGVDWILETHVHADHLTAAPYLKDKLGGTVVIGEHVTTVQETFIGLFNVDDVTPDGRQFGRLVGDGDVLELGGLEIKVMHTPGHTPACVTYVVGDAAFVGDTMFMPDYGAARCDFPGGDARTLYRSIRRILDLPAETRLFMCHDYPPAGRAAAWETSVAAERAENVHAHDGVSEDEFTAMRTRRDATLDMPTLIMQSVQVNMRAGHTPPPEDNGVTYLKFPVDAL